MQCQLASKAAATRSSEVVMSSSIRRTLVVAAGIAVLGALALTPKLTPEVLARIDAVTAPLAE